MAANRNADKANWPRGLYAPRPGYFVYRSPISGRGVTLGKIELNEAIAYANLQNKSADEFLMADLVNRAKNPHELIDDRGLFTAEHIAKKAMVYDRICGIYFLLKDDAVVYVGQSISVLTRLGEHKRDQGKDFNRVYVIECPPESMARLEAMYIDKFKPIYNVSYPFVDEKAPVWDTNIRAMLGGSIHMLK